MNKVNTKKIILGAILALAAGIGLYFVMTMDAPKPVSQTQVSQTQVSTPAQTATRPTTRKKRVYPKEIKGEVITLKVLTKEAAFNYYLAFDDDVRKSLEFPEKVTFGYVENYVSRQAEKVKKDKMIAYSIWDNVDNKMVGSLQIRDLNDYDPGQLGMWINKNYRGGGRIQEALKLISRAYFKQNPHEKCYNAHVRPWNIASQRAMEKFGLKKARDYIEDGKVTRYVYEMAREDVEKIGARP